MDKYEKYVEIGKVATEIIIEENAHPHLKDGRRLAGLRRRAADINIDLARQETSAKRKAILLDVAARHLEKAGDIEKAWEIQKRAYDYLRKYMADRTEH